MQHQQFNNNNKQIINHQHTNSNNMTIYNQQCNNNNEIQQHFNNGQQKNINYSNNKMYNSQNMYSNNNNNNQNNVGHSNQNNNNYSLNINKNSLNYNHNSNNYNYNNNQNNMNYNMSGTQYSYNYNNNQNNMNNSFNNYYNQKPFNNNNNTNNNMVNFNDDNGDINEMGPSIDFSSPNVLFCIQSAISLFIGIFLIISGVSPWSSVNNIDIYLKDFNLVLILVILGILLNFIYLISLALSFFKVLPSNFPISSFMYTPSLNFLLLLIAIICGFVIKQTISITVLFLQVTLSYSLILGSPQAESNKVLSGTFLFIASIVLNLILALVSILFKKYFENGVIKNNYKTLKEIEIINNSNRNIQNYGNNNQSNNFNNNKIQNNNNNINNNYNFNDNNNPQIILDSEKQLNQYVNQLNGYFNDNGSQFHGTEPPTAHLENTIDDLQNYINQLKTTIQVPPQNYAPNNINFNIVNQNSNEFDDSTSPLTLVNNNQNI